MSDLSGDERPELDYFFNACAEIGFESVRFHRYGDSSDEDSLAVWNVLDDWASSDGKPLVLGFDFPADVRETVFAIKLDAEVHSTRKTVWIDASDALRLPDATVERLQQLFGAKGILIPTPLAHQSLPPEVLDEFNRQEPLVLVNFGFTGETFLTNCREKGIHPDECARQLINALRDLNDSLTGRHRMTVALPRFMLSDGIWRCLDWATRYVAAPLFAEEYRERWQYAEHLLQRPLPFCLRKLLCANSNCLVHAVVDFMDEHGTGLSAEIETASDSQTMCKLAESLHDEGFSEVAFRLETFCRSRRLQQSTISLSAEVHQPGSRICGVLSAASDQGNRETELGLAAERSAEFPSVSESGPVFADEHVIPYGVERCPALVHRGFLYGDNGGGKTTSLRQIEHEWAVPRTREHGISHPAWVPLYVQVVSNTAGAWPEPLFRQLALNSELRLGHTTVTLKCHRTLAELASFDDLQRLFSSPLYVLLDDVRNEDFGAHLLDNIQTENQTRSDQVGALCGVTSEPRHDVEEDAGGRAIVKLRPLSISQVMALLETWGRGDRAVVDHTHGPIRAYVRNPYLLDAVSQLGLAEAEYAELNLYRLLDSRFKQATTRLDGEQAERLRRQLRQFAFDMKCELATALLPREELGLDVLKDAEELNLVRLIRTNPLNGKGDIEAIEFLDKYQRDFLAADHLLKSNELVEELKKQLKQDVTLWPLWVNVLRIVAGGLEDQNELGALITQLSRLDETGDLAIECLREVPRKNWPPEADDLMETVKSRLETGRHDMAERNGQRTDAPDIDNDVEFEQRLKLARAVSFLDPRLPVPESGPELVSIHGADSVERFRIGKYPVTNFEFAHFVESGGYTTSAREFWLNWAWEWREKHDIQFPRFWHDARLNEPNAPVVGISVYEALAYGRWLTQVNGQVNGKEGRFGLPGTWQWDVSAGVPDMVLELLASLSDDFVEAQATSQDSATSVDRSKRFAELMDRVHEVPVEFLESHDRQMTYGQLTSIGLFPPNERGCHDMYGNVWQWCNDYLVSRTQEGRPDTDNQQQPVMVKGGTTGKVIDPIPIVWGSWFAPDIRFERLGFRVCWMPFEDKSQP